MCVCVCVAFAPECITAVKKSEWDTRADRIRELAQRQEKRKNG